MNNDLEQFSEERLKDMQKHVAAGMALGYADALLIHRIIDIALSVKQAKPVRFMAEWSSQYGGMECDYSEVRSEMEDVAAEHDGSVIDFYTTPQPAHTEHDGWIKCSERMPDDGKIVAIINAGHGEIYEAATVTRSGPHFILMDGLEASNYDGGAVVTISMEATHWMTLPAAPKPEIE